MSIAGSIIGCIFWGALLGLLLTAAVAVGILLCTRGRSLTPVQLFVLVLTWLLLTVQAMLWLGADKVRTLTGEVRPAVTRLIGWLDVSPAVSQALQEGETLTSELADELDTSAGRYQRRRTLWALGIALTGTAAGICFSEKDSRRTASGRAWGRTGRHLATRRHPRRALHHRA